MAHQRFSGPRAFEMQLLCFLATLTTLAFYFWFHVLNLLTVTALTFVPM